MHLRGWCVSAGAPIAGVAVVFAKTGDRVPLRSFGRPSPDIAAALSPAATHARFDELIPLPPTHQGGDFQLEVRLSDGSVTRTGSAHDNARLGDPSHTCWYRFLNRLHGLPSGDVLEIGSRARSGITRRHLIAPQLGYVGLDILPGPNVDLVGDAHELSAVVGSRRFAAVFALSVFEHLAMPWKVVLELNRVLAAGGLVFIQTPQTWPLHEEPFDFWRFSVHAWRCLFNRQTGFEILETAQGERAKIVPLWDAPVMHGLSDAPAYLNSMVLARKVAETTLAWPVPPAEVTVGSYPTDTLAVPPQ